MKIGQTVYEVIERWWGYPSIATRTITHKKITTETSSTGDEETLVEYGYTKNGETKYLIPKYTYEHKQAAREAYITAYNRQNKKERFDLNLESERFEKACKRWESW